MHYSLTRATAWNIAGYTYLIIASLISTPILVRHLGVDTFAQYGLILGTLSLTSALDLGLPQAVVRALSRDHEFSVLRQTLWATSSFLFILTGIIAASLTTFISYHLGIIGWVLPIIFAIALMNNLLAHYATLPQAEGHFGYYNAKTFIVGTGNTIVAAYLSYIGQSVPTILVSTLFTYLLTLVPLAYFSLKFFPHPRAGKVSFVLARSLVSFGLKNQLGKLIGQTQAQYGKYLLAALSPLTLSAYVISQGLVQKLVGGVIQVSTAFYPASARAGVGPSVRKIYLRLQLGLFVLGLFAIGLYQLVGQSFLTWWLHDEALVSAAHSFLSIYRFYGLFLLLTPLASTVLDSTGHPGTTSLYGAITFALELVIALILLPHYGLLALAYAGIVSIILTTPALLYTTSRVLKSKV